MVCVCHELRKCCCVFCDLFCCRVCLLVCSCLTKTILTIESGNAVIVRIRRLSVSGVESMSVSVRMLSVLLYMSYYLSLRGLVSWRLMRGEDR